MEEWNIEKLNNGMDELIKEKRFKKFEENEDARKELEEILLQVTNIAKPSNFKVENPHIHQLISTQNGYLINYQQSYLSEESEEKGVMNAIYFIWNKVGKLGLTVVDATKATLHVEKVREEGHLNFNLRYYGDKHIREKGLTLRRKTMQDFMREEDIRSVIFESEEYKKLEKKEAESNYFVYERHMGFTEEGWEKRAGFYGA